jgi:hypothetical protein
VYSCSGSECKELLARLGWREVAQALNDPALIVMLTKFRQRASQFLDVLEHPDPQQLLFQRANEGFDAAVAFWLAHKRWRRLHAQKSDFGLIVIAHVLAAVVVPVADARRRAGPEAAAVVAHSLPQRFQRLEPRGFFRRMQAHAFRGAAIHRHEHGHRCRSPKLRKSLNSVLVSML